MPLMKERLGLEADTESIMHASHADTVRQSAQVKGPPADTVKTSRSVVTTRMASVIGSRSKTTVLFGDMQTHTYIGSSEA